MSFTKLFTPKELLAIETFLDHTDNASDKNNEYIKTFRNYQRNVLTVLKKYPKEVREIEDK